MNLLFKALGYTLLAGILGGMCTVLILTLYLYALGPIPDVVRFFACMVPTLAIGLFFLDNYIMRNLHDSPRNHYHS
jgi:hypothetical protein